MAYLLYANAFIQAKRFIMVLIFALHTGTG